MRLQPQYFFRTRVFIETGPHKHAIQQTFFLYVYEPGGNRFEIANPTARLIVAPDWKTFGHRFEKEYLSLSVDIKEMRQGWR